MESTGKLGKNLESVPTPTSALLEGPRHEAVAEILADPAPVLSHVFAALEHRLSPDAVFDKMRI